MTETGPIYGTPLIKTLPLGSSGMLQACPSRADLEQVAEVNTRTAAAYEVLLGHWQRLQKEHRELQKQVSHREMCEHELRRVFDPQGTMTINEIGQLLASKMRHLNRLITQQEQDQ